MKAYLLGNCQVGTVADSLETLVPGLSCKRRLISNNPEELKIELIEAASSDADVHIVHDSVSRLVERTFSLQNILPASTIVIPTITFGAFHPDIQYVFSKEGVVKNGLKSDWNSRLLIWAFLNGWSVDEAMRLFRNEIFERMGYFSAWEDSISSLSEAFDLSSLDFRKWMRSVQRSGVFMYGVNHPTGFCLKELARQIANIHFGIMTTTDSLDSIQDYLSHIVWPVYPEVGERLGVLGSTYWQVNSLKVQLPDFAHMCFSEWSRNKLNLELVNFMPPLTESHAAALSDPLARQ